MQALAATGQTEVAQALGVSESTVSRMKDKDLIELSKLLALCKLKVVPQHFECEAPEELASLRWFARRYMELTVKNPGPGLSFDE